MKGENWDFTLLTCLCLVFFGADVSSVELPRPGNLNLSWSSDGFSVTANWSEPAGLDCKVVYELKKSEECSPDGTTVCEWRTRRLSLTWDTDQNKTCINLITVPENCINKTQSKPLFECLSRSEGVVKDFSCVYYSHMKMNCTWSLINQASDLQLFYKDKYSTDLKPCVTYIENGSTRTGCHLFGEEFLEQELYFLVNRTHEGATVKSNFIRNVKNSVKIPPPKLNITREGKHLRFQSSVPDFKQGCWEYKFHHKKCAKAEIVNKVEKNEITVEYDEACRYSVRVQALFSKYCGAGWSEISEPEYFGEDGDPNRLMMLALILTPVIVSCCLIMAVVLCRKYKDDIFPKIPEPSLLFKDMLSSNRERDLYVGRLYEPNEEVVEKKISLEPDCAALLQICEKHISVP